jgi:hypothetical protein
LLSGNVWRQQQQTNNRDDQERKKLVNGEPASLVHILELRGGQISAQACLPTNAATSQGGKGSALASDCRRSGTIKPNKVFKKKFTKSLDENSNVLFTVLRGK